MLANRRARALATVVAGLVEVEILMRHTMRLRMIYTCGMWQTGGVRITLTQIIQNLGQSHGRLVTSKLCKVARADWSLRHTWGV